MAIAENLLTTKETSETRRTFWNTKCCQMITNILTEYPYLRLGQLMMNLYKEPEEMFYEEPQYTYKRLDKFYKKLKEYDV